MLSVRSINQRRHKRAAWIDSVAGLASGRLRPLTSLCFFSPPQDKLCHTNTPHHMLSLSPLHLTVSSIKTLMDVLALCHSDDSILICHCWISEKLKEAGGRRRGEDILQVRREH